MKLTNAKYYVVPLVLCVLSVIGMTYYYFFTGFSVQKATAFLYVDNDDTADSVFVKLDSIGSRHAMTGLRTLVRHSDYADHLKTGRYAIDPDVSTYQLFGLLKGGRQTPMMLTIPETRTISRMAALLGRKLMADSADLADEWLDANSLEKMEADTATLPCLFIPNTYEVYWNISPSKLMERMKKEHDAFWNKERRDKAARLGLTPNEVTILASIVDEETANVAEKNMVAGLYLNRLRKPMLLQADPTVKFAVGDFTLRRILSKHLSVDNPYNTYRHMGLPPGPIKVASVAGIDAVLNATQHNYLYMCAKEDFSGTHNFAATIQEHMQNARRYQKALNERNIR